MLLREHPGGQGGGGIAGQHGHHGLVQDGAHVQLGGDLVHRAARKLAARVDGPLVRVQAGKGGNSEGWMLISRPA